jgi:hypothetical protein
MDLNREYQKSFDYLNYKTFNIILTDKRNFDTKTEERERCESDYKPIG